MTNRILALGANKASADEELMAKPLFSVSFSVKVKSYTKIIPDCAKAALQAIIRGKVSLKSVIHSDHNPEFLVRNFLTYRSRDAQNYTFINVYVK